MGCCSPWRSQIMGHDLASEITRTTFSQLNFLQILHYSCETFWKSITVFIFVWTICLVILPKIVCFLAVMSYFNHVEPIWNKILVYTHVCCYVEGSLSPRTYRFQLNNSKEAWHPRICHLHCNDFQYPLKVFSNHLFYCKWNKICSAIYQKLCLSLGALDKYADHKWAIYHIKPQTTQRKVCRVPYSTKNPILETSLVFWWLRTRQPMQGALVWSLVWEDSTCQGQLSLCNTTTEPMCLETLLCNKIARWNEKSMHHNKKPMPKHNATKRKHAPRETQHR